MLPPTRPQSQGANFCVVRGPPNGGPAGSGCQCPEPCLGSCEQEKQQVQVQKCLSLGLPDAPSESDRQSLRHVHTFQGGNQPGVHGQAGPLLLPLQGWAGAVRPGRRGGHVRAGTCRAVNLVQGSTRPEGGKEVPEPGAKAQLRLQHKQAAGGQPRPGEREGGGDEGLPSGVCPCPPTFVADEFPL